MVNVVVTKQKNIQINSSSTGSSLTTQAPVVLKNNPAFSVATQSTKLSQLQDVVPNALANGATLVYNTSTDEFYIEAINLDGGVF